MLFDSNSTVLKSIRFVSGNQTKTLCKKSGHIKSEVMQCNSFLHNSISRK